ncbi:MAG: acyl carrier protein [Clostridiales bacterium]|nr:acyl carrier protein [Clostridiales bacterium]
MAVSKRKENHSEDNKQMSFEKEDIFATLANMLSELLNMPKDSFSEDTMIFEELPMDSLQLYELVVDLEARYDIRIPDEAIEKVTTIGDVVNMIHEAGN